MGAIDLSKVPFERLTMEERMDVLLSKVEYGLKKYQTDATFRYCVTALAHGEEPIKLIDHLCSVNNNAFKSMQDMMERMPFPVMHIPTE